MFIIKNKKIFIGISAILVLFSIVSIFTFRMKAGIDFKGGALSEISYSGIRPSITEIESSLKNIGITSLVQPTGEAGYILKTRDLSDKEHSSMLEALSFSGKYKAEEKSFNSIGPSIGKELANKAVVAIILVSLAIICFIAFAFRKVSKPVSSWKYGLIAIATLLHDVLIPVGIFSIISKVTGAEIDTLFVVAILTILGLSVSDTIVVFDRIRENLKHYSGDGFGAIVGGSLEQSYQRSVNTSLTVILALLSLYFFGPSSTKYFALMLTAGMFFGTYSSIFLASPLLVWVEEIQKKNKKK